MMKPMRFAEFVHNYEKYGGFLLRASKSVRRTFMRLWYDDLGAVDLSSFNKVLSGLSCQWDVNKNIAGLANPANNANSFSITGSYTFGTATGRIINQVVSGTLIVANGATNNFATDTMVGIVNAIGTASPTFTTFKEIIIELLAASQQDTAGTAGTACSSVSLGNHATLAWVGPFGAAGVYTLLNGDKWHHICNTTTGISAGTGKVLKILNNDGAVAANLRMTWLGVA